VVRFAPTFPSASFDPSDKRDRKIREAVAGTTPFQNNDRTSRVVFVPCRTVFVSEDYFRFSPSSLHSYTHPLTLLLLKSGRARLGGRSCLTSHQSLDSFALRPGMRQFLDGSPLLRTFCTPQRNVLLLPASQRCVQLTSPQRKPDKAALPNHHSALSQETHGRWRRPVRFYFRRPTRIRRPPHHTHYMMCCPPSPGQSITPSISHRSSSGNSGHTDCREQPLHLRSKSPPLPESPRPYSESQNASRFAANLAIFIVA